MQRTKNKDLIAEYLDKEKAWTSEKRRVRDRFLKLLISIFDNPSINFILRPHPLSDPQYWHENLVKSRNASLYRGLSPGYLLLVD